MAARTALCLLLLSLLPVLCSTARLARQVSPGDKEMFGQLIQDSLLQLATTNRIIPDQAGQAGNVNYRIWNITIDNVRVPQMDIQEAGPGSLRLSLTGLGIAVSARWNVTYINKFLPLRVHGGASANITGLSLTVTVTIEDLADGRIKITLTGCRSSVDSLEVRLTGSLAVIYSLFKPTVEKRLSTLIPEKICSQVREYIIKV